MRKCARLVEFAPLTFFRRAYIADGRESGEATKKSPEGLFLSRSHSIDVSREHRAFLDVGDADAVIRSADGEAAVRRHAVSLPSLPRAAGAHTPHPAWLFRTPIGRIRVSRKAIFHIPYQPLTSHLLPTYQPTATQ